MLPDSAPIPLDSDLSVFMDLHTGIPHFGIAGYPRDRHSHARKRVVGYPKNMWIWFRGDFVYLQHRLGTPECSSQVALTRLAAAQWAALTPEQKTPWENAAQEAKERFRLERARAEPEEAGPVAQEEASSVVEGGATQAAGEEATPVDAE